MQNEIMEEKIKKTRPFWLSLKLAKPPPPFQLMPPQGLHAFPPFPLLVFSLCVTQRGFFLWAIKQEVGGKINYIDSKKARTSLQESQDWDVVITDMDPNSARMVVNQVKISDWPGSICAQGTWGRPWSVKWSMNCVQRTRPSAARAIRQASYFYLPSFNLIKMLS